MIYTSGIHILLSKGFKDLLQIFSADADSRIRDRPSADQLMIMGRESMDLRMDRPIFSVVFDTVTVNIHHGTTEVQRASVYKGMFVYLRCDMNGEINAVFLCLHIDQHLCFFFISDQIKRFMVEYKSTLLDFGHIQHIIDERKQMTGRNECFFTIIFKEFNIIFMFFINFQQTNDPIQRCTHIVGHTGKEIGFLCIGAFGSVKSFFKELLVPDL